MNKEYLLLIEKSVLKTLNSLPLKPYKQVTMKLFLLQKNPFPQDSKKLKGFDKSYRVDQGEYRILYLVEDDKIAEWEYACRGGSETKYYFGDDNNQLGNYGWYNGNSNSQTHPVGQKKPNNWGLYDMLGNVWEWCEDDYIDNYNNTPTDGTSYIDSNMEDKCLRGGSWYDVYNYCRCAYRYGAGRAYISNGDGFRVVCVFFENYLLILYTFTR